MSDNTTPPTMPKIVDLQTSRTSPLIADDPPRGRTQFQALMDGAREAMAWRDPLRGLETSRSAQAAAALLVLAENHRHEEAGS